MNSQTLTNLPTDLLRTFVTIADLNGFTRAGSVLGRSQPAISLQIKRLGELVSAPLFQRNGRKLQLTEEGETLLRYSREMLRINDEAVHCLIKPRVTGKIRLGIPNEFAISVLPQVLGQFSQSYPDVSLEVTCELSVNLLDRLQSREFDLVVAIHRKPVSRSLRVWNEDLVWVSAEGHSAHTRLPIPLVVAPKGCIYRSSIVETLNNAELPWRIVYTSTSYGGINAAVLAGLGVTVLARSTVPEGLRMLGQTDNFPSLSPAAVALHYDQEMAPKAVIRLVEYIRSSLGHHPG